MEKSEALIGRLNGTGIGAEKLVILTLLPTDLLIQTSTTGRMINEISMPYRLAQMDVLARFNARR